MESQKKLLEERIARSFKASASQDPTFKYGVDSCLLSPVSSLLSSYVS